ncbi:DUF4483 domain-containing protein [archaeon]|nr:MAG: DUF4483 domain-containing protein [archaeon]
MSEQLHTPPKKRTIIKDRVGCVRTSTYSLPGDTHTYGKKTEMSAEGSAECKLCVLYYVNGIAYLIPTSIYPCMHTSIISCNASHAQAHIHTFTYTCTVSP